MDRRNNNVVCQKKYKSNITKYINTDFDSTHQLTSHGLSQEIKKIDFISGYEKILNLSTLLTILIWLFLKLLNNWRSLT